MRPAPTEQELCRLRADGVQRLTLWENIRRASLTTAFHAVDVQFPATQPPGPAPHSVLNKPLQAAMSAFIRRTRMPLKQFVELVRCQTPDDYRPNKALLPNVLRAYCQDYEHLDDLVRIASEGTCVRLTSQLPNQDEFPRNHPSATQRINVLRTNIRKEQDAFRCLVIDADIETLWPELFISPFGVVDKGTADPLHSGRVIHDLSFPDGESVNSTTDQAAIPSASFEHCASIAQEILRCQDSTPVADIKLMAGDVTLAYRMPAYIPIASTCSPATSLKTTPS
jgi:hypothetical protein